MCDMKSSFGKQAEVWVHDCDDYAYRYVDDPSRLCIYIAVWTLTLDLIPKLLN